MYQVISVRVLRQALSWMGIPAPWFRTTDFMRWPDGRLTSTIKCMWNYSDIDPWYSERLEAVTTYPMIFSAEQMARVLWVALAECFCEDIQVVTCRYEPGPHWFSAYLACTVMPHDPDPFPLDEKWAGYPDRFEL